MIEDSVLQEVRAARDAFARSFGYDVHAMGAYLRELDERGDWPVVRLAPRRPAASEVLPLDQISARLSHHCKSIRLNP